MKRTLSALVFASAGNWPSLIQDGTDAALLADLLGQFLLLGLRHLLGRLEGRRACGDGVAAERA